MTLHANALLAALYQRLAGDPALAALTGPKAIFDVAPLRKQRPYVLFSSIESQPWSTMTEAGEEHHLQLEVHADGQGHRQVLQIASRIAELTDDQPLVLDGAHLVSMTLEMCRTRRDRQGREIIAELRLRAVTE